MEERVEFSYLLLQLERVRVGRRALHIRGRFLKTTQDAYGCREKGPLARVLWVPRTFPQAQEQALLHFLAQQAPQASRQKS